MTAASVDRPRGNGEGAPLQRTPLHCLDDRQVSANLAMGDNVDILGTETSSPAESAVLALNAARVVWTLDSAGRPLLLVMDRDE